MNPVISAIRRLSMLAVAAALVVTTMLVSAQSASAETYTVKMGADNGMLAFEPKTLTIQKGDTVTWVNNKAFPHNVVFESKDGAIAAHSQKALASAPAQEFSETFDDVEPGEYSYFCVPHRGAGMVGKLIIQ